VGLFFCKFCMRPPFQKRNKRDIPDRSTQMQKNEILKLRSQGCSYNNIALRLSISVNTVKSVCRRNVVEPIDLKNARCKQCGQPISLREKHRPKQFCSDKCRKDWWLEHNVKSKTEYSVTCSFCGKMFKSYGSKNRKYCSHQCYIADRFGKASDADG
jgi:endogenous inhibitor of DNA gyrase (YacG/DUF329 family)